MQARAEAINSIKKQLHHDKILITLKDQKLNNTNVVCTEQAHAIIEAIVVSKQMKNRFTGIIECTNNIEKKGTKWNTSERYVLLYDVLGGSS
jgi:hypothetical protein